MRKLHPETIVHPLSEGWPAREERLRPRSVAMPDSLITRLDALVECDACQADSRSEAVRLACRAWIAEREPALKADTGTPDRTTVYGPRTADDGIPDDPRPV